MLGSTLLAESDIHFEEPAALLLPTCPEATVYEAIEQMSQNQVGALVVLSAKDWMALFQSATMPAK